MSCAANQTTATTNFTSASYSASGSNIGLTEETKSSNNTATLTGVRGKVRLNLTAYASPVTGDCQVYFKVAAQTNGSSNTPPVTADSTYRAALTATLGIINTSGYYANSTPTFSGSNDCSTSDKLLGWALTDIIGVVRPNFRYNC